MPGDPRAAVGLDHQIGLDGLGLAGGRLVAALDTDAGGAVVRVVTADGRRLHLWAPVTKGHLEVAGAGGGTDLGPIGFAEVVDGEVRLAGPFGWLSVPALDRVEHLDRWRGPVSDPGEGAAEDLAADDQRSVAVRTLGRPDVEVRITRTSADGATAEILLAASDGAAVSVPSTAGVEGDAVVFEPGDLTMRMLEEAGLLAHPTAPTSSAPVAGRAAQLVTVVVTRSEDDGAIAGGFLRWIDDGPTGSVRVVEQAEQRGGEPTVTATRRRVSSVATELLGYVVGAPDPSDASGPAGPP